MKEYICDYCGKSFGSHQALGGHVVFCKKNPNCRTDEFNKKLGEKKHNGACFENYHLHCAVCGNEYVLNISKNSFNKNRYRKTYCDECSKKLTSNNTNEENRKNKISVSVKKYFNEHKPHNYGKRKTRYCKHCGTVIPDNRHDSKYCSEYCKSFAWKTGNMGGMRPNAYKKYKSGVYHSIHCDSSWELAFLLYCEDHDICVIRNTRYLTYVFNSKQYKYYPDFIINGTLYEIKGYEDPKAIEKHKQHPEVVYLDKHSMKKYLDYVVFKYGKDFIRMYDKLDKSVK